MTNPRQYAMTEEEKQLLIQKATEAQKKAYCPYSKFFVGAAILAENGKIYTGANIENQSYGLTVCAERTASFAMVNDGCLGIKAVAVITEPGVSCCGACRQVLVEFAKQYPDFIVYICSNKGDVVTTSIETLLPGQCDIKQLVSAEHKSAMN